MSRTIRSLPLRSFRLGLAGKADVVEYSLNGRTPPLPVEYKRGKPKPTREDEIQLCAQALCLEEMTGAVVPCGALYYGTPRRRQQVILTPSLRRQTELLAERLHVLFWEGITPPACWDKKCRNCSLLDLCRPRVLNPSRRASAHLSAAIAAHLDET